MANPLVILQQGKAESPLIHTGKAREKSAEVMDTGMAGVSVPLRSGESWPRAAEPSYHRCGLECKDGSSARSPLD